MSEVTPDITTDPTAQEQPQKVAVNLPETSASASSEIHGMDLPTHARGLLKVRVPVRVTLAAQRKSIHEIIELGPGTIVKFNKTCDEPLEMTVGDRPFATGEVVKVGDKFGVRISGIK